MYRFIFLVLIVLEVGACATTELSETERTALVTVSVPKPTLGRKMPFVVAHLRLGDPSEGSNYSNLAEMHQAIYEKNNIDIMKIVHGEFLAKIKDRGRLQLVGDGGDLEIRIEIASYGFGPGQPFTIQQKPTIQLILQGITKDGRRAWYSTGTITVWFSKTKSNDPFELVNNPKIIEENFHEVSRYAIELALNGYEKL